MAKVPDGRHSSCAELSDALTNWLRTAGPAAHAAMVPTATFAPNFPPGTDSNWAHTGSAGDPVVIPKRSSIPLVLALGAAGFVLLAGGSFAAYRLLGSDAPAAAASTNADSVDAVPRVEEAADAPPVVAHPEVATTPSADSPGESPAQRDPPIAKGVRPVAGKFKPVAPTAAATPTPDPAPAPAPAPKPGMGKAGEWY